jgi:RHS repeat-associated protein
VGLVEYAIDAAGRRVGKKVNGALLKGWLFDGAAIVAELDGAGNVVSRFFPGGMIKGGSTYRILRDHLGSPRLVVNASTGAIAQRMDFDEYGRVLQDTTPGFTPFGFAGGLYDPDTGLVRFGARDYMADVGRWTAKDPIRFAGGDTNLYGYVYGDPINLIDPTGLDARGTMYGFVIGTMLGAVVGGSVGGGGGAAGGTLFAPGVGTIGGGALGVAGGVTIGAGVGGATGAVVGNALGDLYNWWNEDSGDSGGGGSCPADRYKNLSNEELNELIGDQQRQLLREFFGKSVKGARGRMENFHVPEGLARQTLEIYREVANRAIAQGIDGLGVQRLRLQLIERAIN